MITQKKNERGGIYYKVDHLDKMGYITAGGRKETYQDFLEKFCE